jgi:hypothetical protein
MSDRLRRRVAREAARLIFAREESQYGRAKMKAVRHFTAALVPAADLPDNREIRRHLQSFDRSTPDERDELLREREEEREDSARACHDRFRTYELLLLPLEQVPQPPEHHPEGDVLYHSLQVFELARQELPYDEEVLLAALLHDVGKAIDRRDHIAAGLEALDGTITPRTAWLIEHHLDAMALAEGTLGVRHRRRLAADENFNELMLLADCDRRGRIVGMRVSDVQDALAYLRDLSEQCGEDDEPIDNTSARY